jgi:hypothetical protein
MDIIFRDTAPWSPYATSCFAVKYQPHLHDQKLAEQETSVQQGARQNKPPAGRQLYRVQDCNRPSEGLDDVQQRNVPLSGIKPDPSTLQ